jgi:MFS family permease
VHHLLGCNLWIGISGSTCSVFGYRLLSNHELVGFCESSSFISLSQSWYWSISYLPICGVQISDRYGRIPILGFSVLGIALAHLNVIFVSWFVMRLPGNYWLLLVGSITEGLFGGERQGIFSKRFSI